MKANDIFTKAIASSQSDVTYAKRRLANLRSAKRDAMPLLKQIAPALGNEDYVNVQPEGNERVVVSITLDKLEGFKDQRLTHVLYAVMCMADVEEETSRDYPSIMNREYRFKVGGHRVIVNAYAKEDSPTCRKVKVGEKMEVVTQYAIQCD
jgi:hypothetical protein